MEQKQISCDLVLDGLPPVSEKYPCMVAQKLGANDDKGLQGFYSIHDRKLQFQCRIPELHGRLIRGSFHGWLILSSYPKNDMWSLWNPDTSRFVRLPRLIHNTEYFKDLEFCCLSAPPTEPDSVLLLTRFSEPVFVFCRLDPKRKRSRWVKMSYAKQLGRVRDYDITLIGLTCCNGKVYALSCSLVVIHVDIVFKGKDVVINLLPYRVCPYPEFDRPVDSYYLKGSCTELFCIVASHDNVDSSTLDAVNLYKLDMTSTTSVWEKIQDLKDAIFYCDFNHSVYYSNANAPELGGYIHFSDDYGAGILYSCHVKNKTVSLLPMPCLAKPCNVSLWGCRLEGDHREDKPSIDYKQEDERENDEIVIIRSVSEDEMYFNSTMNESRLFNIPFHVLEMIMEFSIGVEYLNFRSTCKRCHLAAPMIQWRNEGVLSKFRTYSLASPWLMVLEYTQGIMYFTDPICGDKYFRNTIPVSIHDDTLICCSRYGWLLFYNDLRCLVFFNPFTSISRELPATPHLLENLCFSAPPTTPNCMVVGFTRDLAHSYFLRLVDSNPLWYRSDLDYRGCDPYAFHFPTFVGQYLYALCDAGKLVHFKEVREEYISWEVITKAPACSPTSGTKYYLVKHDECLLLVTVGEWGEFVDVFEFNESTKEWKKINSIGSHTIFISDAACLCIETKTPKMENKIYFPRLQLKSGKIMYYSLETCRSHELNEKSTDETYKNLFYETQHLLNPHAWIEPTWY